MGDAGFHPLDRYVPDKGWGYSVIVRTWDDYNKYEVCPFYDGGDTERHGRHHVS